MTKDKFHEVQGELHRRANNIRETSRALGLKFDRRTALYSVSDGLASEFGYKNGEELRRDCMTYMQSLRKPKTKRVYTRKNGGGNGRQKTTLAMASGGGVPTSVTNKSTSSVLRVIREKIDIEKVVVRRDLISIMETVEPGFITTVEFCTPTQVEKALEIMKYDFPEYSVARGSGLKILIHS